MEILLESGFKLVDLKNKFGDTYTLKVIEYWHPHSLRYELRDFAHKSPKSYARLGKKIKQLGLCNKQDEKSWDLKKIVNAISENISMNCKLYKDYPCLNKCHTSKIRNNYSCNCNKNLKSIYGNRNNYRKYLIGQISDV
jgi:hypothetical protein